MPQTPSIELALLTGPRSGTRQTFAQGTITFGREGDNTLVLSDAIVSRHHGRIEWQDDHWVLVNQSTNETFVGSRRIRKRPFRLRDRDVIRIGDQPVFEVRLTGDGDDDAVASPAAAAGESPTPAADASVEKAPPRKGRAKIWIIIGVWWLAVVAIGLFFATLEDAESDPSAVPPVLTREQIAADVRQPPAITRVDEHRAAEQLTRARRYWEQRAQSNNLFRTYDAYQRALAYRNNEPFDDATDRLQYAEAERDLIAQVHERYEQAIQLLRNGRLRESQDAFERLQKYYNRPGSVIGENVERYRNYVLIRMEQERIRRRR